MRTYLFPATVTVTYYDSKTGEPYQDEISFGQYREDGFPCVEARNEEAAKDEVQEVLIRDTTNDMDVDKIQIHPAL